MFICKIETSRALVSTCCALVSATGLAYFSTALALNAAPVLGSPAIVVAPVNRIYIPLGFDDNDNVEVILHGSFKNSCYKINDTKFTLDSAAKKIVVSATSLFYKGTNCLQMEIPFLQDIKLGNLAAGEYTVEVQGSPGVAPEKLVVERSRSASPDDYLYAPVRQASLLRANPNGFRTLRLSGTYPHMLLGCMILQEVRTSVTPGNVLVVQPISRIAEDAECSTSKYLFDFVKDVEVPDTLESNLLIHVRVLNGESINAQYDRLP